MSRDEQRPHIEYPCSWTYRLIGQSAEALRACVSEIVGGDDYVLTESKASRLGKYVSLVLTLTVRDEAQRLDVYHRLAGHPAVRIVL